MQGRVGWYDPRVLDAAFACFDIYLAAPTAAKAPSRGITVRELSVGQTLLSNVETKDGSLIVAAGTKVSAMILEKLRNFAELSGIKEPIQVQI